MQLIDYVAAYALRRGLASSTEDVYEKHVRCFYRSVGRIDAGDLSEQALNRHLRRLQHEGKSDSYRKSARTHLLALWRAAARDKTLSRRPDPPDPQELAPVRVRDTQPRGYTAEQVLQLYDAAGRLVGFYQHGISRRLWWRAYLLLAWESGMAPSDVVTFPRASIGSDGRCQTVRKKTGERISFALRPATLEAIAATIPPERPECVPLWGSYEIFRREFRRLRKLADLPGCPKWLRVGSGCDVEQQQPGAGCRHLANSPSVFDKHYRVLAICDTDRPMPRRLF